MNDREAAIHRAPVRCPKCGGSDIVAGDPTGFACDGCGHKARLKDFRRTAARPIDAPLTPSEQAKVGEFLDRFRMRPTPGTLDSIQRDATLAGPITRAMDAETDEDLCEECEQPADACSEDCRCERCVEAAAENAQAAQECGG